MLLSGIIFYSAAADNRHVGQLTTTQENHLQFWLNQYLCIYAYDICMGTQS